MVPPCKRQNLQLWLKQGEYDRCDRCNAEALKKQNLVFRWVLIYALLLAVVIFGMYGPGYDPSAFIYEKF